MILLTGGSGRLGTELQKLMRFQSVPNRDQLNITQPIQIVPSGLKLIVHAAAFTDVVGAESHRELCYATNVLGTRNLASLGIPMLYISTEYVFDGEKGNYAETDYPNPQNFYSLTKLLGEYEARRTKSVVIRCLFKPRPFQHEFACIDQFTSGGYVDEIAKEIALAVKHFSELPPLVHIGFGKKSTYDLAIKTQDVKPCSIYDIKGVKLPADTSLNTGVWENLKKGFRHGNPVCES